MAIFSIHTVDSSCLTTLYLLLFAAAALQLHQHLYLRYVHSNHTGKVTHSMNFCCLIGSEKTISKTGWQKLLMADRKDRSTGHDLWINCYFSLKLGYISAAVIYFINNYFSSYILQPTKMHFGNRYIYLL